MVIIVWTVIIFMTICWIVAPFLLAWAVWYDRTTGKRLESMEKRLSYMKDYLTILSGSLERLVNKLDDKGDA